MVMERRGGLQLLLPRPLSGRVEALARALGASEPHIRVEAVAVVLDPGGDAALELSRVPEEGE